MTDKPASEMSADELWGAIVGAPVYSYCVLHGAAQGDHNDCYANLCPYCFEPATNGQINDGDAFPIDERGVDDQKYAHRECAQGAKYGD